MSINITIYPQSNVNMLVTKKPVRVYTGSSGIKNELPIELPENIILFEYRPGVWRTRHVICGTHLKKSIFRITHTFNTMDNFHMVLFEQDLIEKPPIRQHATKEQFYTKMHFDQYMILASDCIFTCSLFNCMENDRLPVVDANIRLQYWNAIKSLKSAPVKENGYPGQSIAEHLFYQS